MILLSKNSRQKTVNRQQVRELLAEKKEVVIDCLGDSITWGMYSSPQLEKDIESGEIETRLDDGGQLFEDMGIYISGVFQSDPTYPEKMESELNRRFSQAGTEVSVTAVNDGICGDWVTENSYQRISCDPDIVILFFGGNNYYFDYPIDGMFEKNIRVLRNRGKILYLANYPLYPGERHVKEFGSANEYIKMISEKEQVPLIDLYSLVNDVVYEGEGPVPEGMYRRKELFSPDRIHLSQKGYELIGTYIADAIWQDCDPLQTDAEQTK